MSRSGRLVLFVALGSVIVATAAGALHFFKGGRASGGAGEKADVVLGDGGGDSHALEVARADASASDVEPSRNGGASDEVGPPMESPQRDGGPAPPSTSFANTGACPEGMAWIPGGTFQMGSTDGYPDEKPVHAVTVAGFCMDVTEVTAGAYADCVRRGRCNADGLQCGEAATYGESGKDNHPINCVDWDQANAYCRAAGKRLPTEEEWEYTARGGANGWTFPWGNDEPSHQLCWSGNTERDGTCPVGGCSQGANPWGVQDLAGNVEEWTASGWSAAYGKKRITSERVFRGGGWREVEASNVRGAYRGGYAPSYRVDVLGFRCAVTP